MQVNVTDFKTNCTGYLRDIARTHETIEITRWGKVIAIVREPRKPDAVNPLYGCQRGTVLEVSDDFDEPLGDGDWEACQ